MALSRVVRNIPAAAPEAVDELDPVAAAAPAVPLAAA